MSRISNSILRGLVVAGLTFALGLQLPSSALAQETTQQEVSAADAELNKQTADTPNAPAPLTEDELEVLVARIALYPDDLVALITSAALYPVQVVDAERYLEKVATDKSLKPKDSWDGSVISLLNYPDVVKMMSDDLDWTQSLGDAIANQQKDVLVAIQQLRDEAVAKGIIKTDDKIKVVHEENNVIIQPASTEKIYVPKYEPEMLYEPDYVPVPVAYYPDPYPYYYYPTAPYFAGFVTGAIWGAAVDWDRWGVWGGRWNGNDININCKKCFNNINGKVNWNDVDWRHVDRNKIDFDHNQFNNINRRDFNNRIESNRNNIGNKAQNIRNSGNRNSGNRNSGNRVSVNDVRAAKNSGNKVKINNNINVDNSKRVNANNSNNRKNVNANNNRRNDINANNRVHKANTNANINRKKTSNVNNQRANVNRNVRNSRPGEFSDHRYKSPSAFGEVRNGRSSQMSSFRGRQSIGGRSMGGGMRHFGRR